MDFVNEQSGLSTAVSALSRADGLNHTPQDGLKPLEEALTGHQYFAGQSGVGKSVC